MIHGIIKTSINANRGGKKIISVRMVCGTKNADVKAFLPFILSSYNIMPFYLSTMSSPTTDQTPANNLQEDTNRHAGTLKFPGPLYIW